MGKTVKPITAKQKVKVLKKAQTWFTENVAANHSANTKRLVRPSSFKINPFTTVYLANFFTGNSSPLAVARVLVYSRALGTSISTTFGNNIQKFASEVLGSLGSLTPGNDIEFVDKIDGREKFCQLKAGPNNINKDDVKTIKDHFDEIFRRARTNNRKLTRDDLIVGVVYGKTSELSGHYKKLTNKHDIPIYVGQDFWVRLTGDPDFYLDLIASIREAAEKVDFKKDLEKIVKQLSKTEEIIRIATGGDAV